MTPWRSNAPDYKWDLMISYCWAQQTLVLKLKEKLETKGFSIWFDTEQMPKYKSMPEAMGDGISNSFAIIMCISPDYEKSGRCEQEAEFVSQKNKARFIIKVAKNYNPKTKWLQFLMGDRLYFEMETQKKLHSNFEQLEVAIRMIVTPNIADPDTPPQSHRRKRKSVPNLKKLQKTSKSNENLHFGKSLCGRKTISLTGSLSELKIQAFNDSSQFDPDEEEVPQKNSDEHSPLEWSGTRLAKVLNKIYTVRDLFHPTDESSNQNAVPQMNVKINSGKYSTAIPKKMSTDGNFAGAVDQSRSSVGKVSPHICSRSLGEIDLIGVDDVITRPTLLLPKSFVRGTDDASDTKASPVGLSSFNWEYNSTKYRGHGRQVSQFFGRSSMGNLLDL